MSTGLDLVSALSIVGSGLDQRVLQELHARGFPELRRAHGYLFQRLLVAPRTVTDLAAELGVTQQAVSKAAGELVRAGYLERDDDRDRRRRPLALTDRGRAAVTAARCVREELRVQIERSAGDADRVAAVLLVLDAALDVLGLRRAVAERAVPMPAGGEG
ncbi:MarR family transcriptional regulator [Geodermatophilus sp. URMC 61]|uniref:MarR family transcriptional regulator n=1 Tax=Geodermatophilus sp. URMC 61 TaxID=3423411 RepID=UPI00406D2819